MAIQAETATVLIQELIDFKVIKETTIPLEKGFLAPAKTEGDVYALIEGRVRETYTGNYLIIVNTGQFNSYVARVFLDRTRP